MPDGHLSSRITLSVSRNTVAQCVQARQQREQQMISMESAVLVSHLSGWADKQRTADCWPATETAATVCAPNALSNEAEPAAIIPEGRAGERA